MVSLIKKVFRMLGIRAAEERENSELTQKIDEILPSLQGVSVRFKWYLLELTKLEQNHKLAIVALKDGRKIRAIRYVDNAEGNYHNIRQAYGEGTEEHKSLFFCAEERRRHYRKEMDKMPEWQETAGFLK